MCSSDLMISKYRDGVVPDSASNGLQSEANEALAAARASIARLKVHDAFASAMDLARAANVYVEERQPWAQAKDPARAAELDETLSTLAHVLVVLCALFQPVAPEKMELLADRLGLDGVPTLQEAVTTVMAGRSVTPGNPLFPRVDPTWADGND